MSIKKLFDLSGKVALVTGGSRGLGLQMAEALGEMGAKVAITARKQDELDAAAAHLRQQGIETITVQGDLGQVEAAEATVDAVLKSYGTIDILVNNAGTTWGTPAEEHSLEAWDKVMNLNVRGIFLLSQIVGRRVMIPRKSGKIVNISSIAGLGGNPPDWDMHTIAYNTSKGAVANFTRTLASEWGHYNINVNAICPGYFPSKMTKGLLSRLDQQVVLKATPLARLGGEEDLKGAMVYLASAASDFVTGQMLVVDGGLTGY